ncbi:hypothetical protein BD309DRAFT_946792 [Dichomitus squalens]|nr:hypothetical protein BD309DRAFT_946792 [Dichomitus squalens]
MPRTDPHATRQETRHRMWVTIIHLPALSFGDLKSERLGRRCIRLCILPVPYAVRFVSIRRARWKLDDPRRLTALVLESRHPFTSPTAPRICTHALIRPLTGPLGRRHSKVTARLRSPAPPCTGAPLCTTTRRPVCRGRYYDTRSNAAYGVLRLRWARMETTRLRQLHGGPITALATTLCHRISQNCRGDHCEGRTGCRMRAGSGDCRSFFRS